MRTWLNLLFMWMLLSAAPVFADWIPAPDTAHGEDFARLAATVVRQGEFIDQGDLEGENLAAAYMLRGTCYRDLGRVEHAQNDLEMALELDPNNAAALNNLAWMLSTRQDRFNRDGERAVELARRAVEVTGGENASMLDTLAAALAQAGDYTAAVNMQKLALGELQMPSREQPGFVERLQAYEAGETTIDLAPMLP